MSRTLDEVMEGLPAAQRAAVERRAEALIAEEMSLRDLRRSLKLTQTDVAKRLKKGQEVVSRIEKRNDLRLSTLQDYIESLGGELELVCRFKAGGFVRVTTKTAKARATTHFGRRAVAA